MKQENSISYIFILIKYSFFSMRRGNASLAVALLGVVVGLCSLIAITGIMNGMQGILINKLVSIESYDYQGTGPSYDIRESIRRLGSMEEVELVVPYIDEFVFIESSSSHAIAHIRAVDREQFNNDSKLLNALSLPTEDGEQYLYTSQSLASVNEQSEEQVTSIVPNILLGFDLYVSLGLNVGDMVSVILPGAGQGFAPVRTQMKVEGAFYSRSDYDLQWAFIAMDDYFSVLGLNANDVETIQYGVRVDSNRGIRKLLAEKFEKVSSWQENNNAFFIALRSEKIVLIVLVAVIFGIIILHFRFSMVRRIKRKKDDIVALRTIGATPKDINAWFLGETVVIGIIGTILGTLAGLGILYGYPYIEAWVAMNVGYVFNIGNTVGGEISVQELLLFIAFTWITILVSSLRIIRRTTKISPMQVLRYE